MSEQRDLYLTPQQSFSGSPFADHRDGASRAFDEQPVDHVPGSLSTMNRLKRAALLVAAFFCGWSILRVAQLNLTLSDILICVVMVAMLSRGEINRKPFGNLTAFWLLGLGLMLLGLFIGSIINGGVDRWLIVGAQYVFSFALIPMLLSGQETSLTRILPALLVIGMAVSELIGISVSLLFDYSDTKDVLGVGFLTGNGRLGSMTGHPNSNGAMIAFALPMLLYSVRRGTIPLGIGILCGVLLVWGLLASGSFTAFSASMIAVGIYLAISGIKMLVRVSILGAIGVALFLASGLPLPATFEKRVAGALTTGDLSEAGTFTGRSELIDEAWAMAEDNSIIGLGVDQYRLISVHGAPVHEFHLLIWNEGGITAFAGIVVMLLTMVAAGFVAVTRSRIEGALILSVIAVFNVYTVSVPHMYSRAWILPVMLAMSTYFASRPIFSRSNH
ncbi:O-antigen ligase family protein [Aurantiacibacter flavus]|uniref:O-antigen ligase domain-containing protein n=1 Tax=Aurantiacibacter flavus TaxID=3145232 RepID=A0ABV0D1R7_9SPHN